MSRTRDGDLWGRGRDFGILTFYSVKWPCKSYEFEIFQLASKQGE
jgi:hypothetical protein